MISICWLDINSSYSHSSMALPAIHAQYKDSETNENAEWQKLSYTTSSSKEEIIRCLIASECDLVCCTCWLFNHLFVQEILSRFKQVCPHATVVLGGPEFLGDNENYLKVHPHIDAVFRGEGENEFFQFLARFREREAWKEVKGLCFLNQGRYIDGGMAVAENFALLNPPSESRFFPLDKPFVQLETSRGCYNSCAFCVSGQENSIVVHQLSDVEKQLDHFVAKRIKEIRILDRTFNSHPKRAIDLLDLFRRYLGRLSFHLEIHPSLLTKEIREKLKEMPKGLLHFEAGIQSLNQSVINKITRKGSVETTVEGLKFLISSVQSEIHVDLIAGLPTYTLPHLMEDTRVLIEMGCHEIQIELLKLLPGTVLRKRAREMNIAYSPLPPYEVLSTDATTFDELCKAVTLSKCIDIFYNDPLMRPLFSKVVASDSLFLTRFVEHSYTHHYFESPQSKEQRASILFNYLLANDNNWLFDIQLLWLNAGFSLYKTPHTEVKSYKMRGDETVKPLIGCFHSNQRLYCFYSEEKSVLIGFDRSVNQNAPLFIGLILQQQSDNYPLPLQPQCLDLP